MVNIPQPVHESHSGSTSPTKRNAIRRGGITALAVIQASWILAYMDYNIYNFTLPLILKDFDISLPTAGLIFFLSGQGIVLGSILIPLLADKIGRLKTMIVNILGYAVATALIPLASSAWHLIAARFVVSAAVGGEQPVGAAYVAEEWSAKKRARAMSFMQSGAAIGTLLATLLVATLGATFGWKILFVIGLIPALLVFVLRFFMPESRKWEDAQHAKRKAPAEGSGAAQDTGVGKFADLFSPKYIRATVLGTVLLILINAAAGGIFAWYPTYLNVARGYDISSIGWLGIVLAIGMFVGYNAFGWSADKIGRRPTFSIAFVVGIGAIGAFTTVSNGAMLGVATFLTGLALAAPFAGYIIYLTELFETPVRATGTGFCMGVGLFFWGLVPYIMSLVAPGGDFSNVFVFIGAGSLLLSLILIWTGPETKGRVII